MAYYISNIRLYNRKSINMNIGFIIKKILGTKYYIVKTKELKKDEILIIGHKIYIGNS